MEKIFEGLIYKEIITRGKVGKYCYPQISKRRAKKAPEIPTIDSPHLQEIRERDGF